MHTFTSHFVRAARSNSGQVMLVTALLMSGMLLGATVVAGLLTVNQLRQATDVTNSARAIFAADAGVELERYRWYKDRDDCHGNPLPTPPPFPASNPNPTISNPFVWERITPYPANVTNCYDQSSAVGIYNPGVDPPTTAIHSIDGATFRVTTYAYRSYYSGGILETKLDHIKVIGKSLNSARAFKATF